MRNDLIRGQFSRGLSDIIGATVSHTLLPHYEPNISLRPHNHNPP